MGIMKEKLEAVMNEWEKEAQAQNNTHTPLSKKIVDYVLKNPNCTAVRVTNYIMDTYPETPKSNVSSILKQLTDKHYLEREDFYDETVHRPSYKYRALSDVKRQELEAIRKAEEKASKERLERMRAQAEAARAAKAAKKEERLKAQEHEDTGVSAGLSAALPAPVELPKQRSSVQEILDSLSITQARAVYDELKKIFGG
jgi:hypothetical protein